MPTIWKNRAEAGMLLAKELERYCRAPDTVVLGIPRGGIVTAKEIADHLEVPLDSIVIRKLGHPMNPETGVGAVDAEGNILINEKLYTANVGELERIKRKEQEEAKRRQNAYQKGKVPESIKGKTVIIADDGIATGMTALLAVQVCRVKGAKRVVVAAPVIAYDMLDRLEDEADEVVYILAPTYFMAVGQYYEQFGSVPDEEVIRLLR